MSDTATLREEMQFKLEQIQRVSGVAPHDLIEASRELLFDFKYPIFDEKYRAELEYKIIHKMWLQQIGATSYGEFKFRLEMWLIQKMPYYNRLYQSMLENDYNPIDDVEYVDNRQTDANKSEDQKGASDYNAVTHNHGTSDTDTTNSASGKTHSTSDTTTNSSEDGNSDVKNSGTKNERKTNLDPPQGELDMSSKYANTVGITNDNHDEDTKTTSNVTSKGSANTTNDGTSSEDSKGTANNVSDSNSTTDSKANNQRHLDGVSKENYIFSRKGRTGANTRGKLIADQRKNIIDVDKLLLDDICRDLLYPLF